MLLSMLILLGQAFLALDLWNKIFVSGFRSKVQSSLGLWSLAQVGFLNDSAELNRALHGTASTDDIQVVIF